MMRYVLPAVLGILLLFQIIGTPCALTGGEAKAGLIEQFAAYFGQNVQVAGCTGA
jgi:hypothetical protein